MVAALALVFLEKPLTRIADHHYTSADVTQGFTLTKVDPPDVVHAPANALLSDPVVEMVPWLIHQRAELAEGRVPLWNERNGCGVPQLANAQSAVLSPFSVPFYVLPLRWALVAAAFAKLFLTALFAWLFLRRLELSTWSALAGAVAYAWSGHAVTLLAYPHSAAAITLPAGLHFADLACERLLARARGSAVAVLGLVASLAAGVLAGQPEPFYFCALTVGAWTLFRLVEARATRSATTPRVASSALVLVAAALCAAGIAAVQLLPFLEYLRESQALGERTAAGTRQLPLAAAAWIFLFFPNLLANPAKLEAGWPRGPAPNFELVNGVTTSTLVVFLAIVSVRWLVGAADRRARAHAAWLAILVLWIAYAYDVWGFASLAARVVPGLAAAPMNRSQPVGVFALCVCAAFAVEHLAALACRDRTRERLLTTLAVVALAGVGAWLCADVAYARLDRFLARNAAPEDFARYARDHVVAMSALFAAGVAAVLSLAWMRPKLLRAGAWLALVAVVFVPWGWMLRNYNPTVADRYVYPRTEAIDRLRQLVHDERVLVLGEDTLPPHTNLVYGLSLPTSYDALGIRAYDQLWKEHFGEGGNWRNALKATHAGLEMLGIRKVLTAGAWLPVETTYGGLRWSERERFRAGAIVPGREVSQTFTAGADGLQAIRFEVATDARANRCTLVFVLEELATSEVVDLQSIDASSLRANAYERCELVFRFAPQRASKGKRYRATLSSPDATASQCVLALATRELAKAERWSLVERPGAPLTDLTPAELTVGGERVQGGLVLDLSYDRELFRRITEFSGFTLWSYEPGTAPYHLVERAIAARDEAEEKALVDAPDFDPASTVVLRASDLRAREAPKTALAESEVHVVHHEATRTKLDVRSSAPAWLVVAQPFYPGWRARVNGAETPILRANRAFQAVEVPAGSCEIELTYEPDSFRRGAWITLASLVALAAGVAWLRRRSLDAPAA